MSYIALYRKYRPNNFENVVGQDTTVDILKNSIKLNRVSHAYLFTGPRGTGKTSIAKIFAHAVNCENFQDDICNNCNTCLSLLDNDSDIIEIDAASNNSVEQVRILRDNVKLLPNFCKYKIYIIDEVHMLSSGAFNALLKTLEEPPSHVIFILATTEPNKIPLTILSRCQRFDFDKISMNSLVSRLKHILKLENRSLSDEVINLIDNLSDGCLRDAVNLLDQVLSLNNDEVDILEVEKMSGKVSERFIFSLLDILYSSNYTEFLKLVDTISLEGKSYLDIVNYMLIIFRNAYINDLVNNYFSIEYSKLISKYALNSGKIIEVTKHLTELSNEIKNASDQRMLFEIYLINLMNIINDNNVTYKQENSATEVVNSENDSNEQKEDEILVKIDNKEIEESNSNEKLQDSDNVQLEKLIEIRINNVFAAANKDILNKVIGDYDRINDFISNKKYNSIVALLIEGKVVVASNDYLLFSFKDESLVTLFHGNYRLIETFLSEIYDVQYKVVAVSEEKWENLKKEFILNKKNNIPYVLIDENDVKLDMSEGLSDLEHSAINIFGEDTVSVK